MTRPKNETELDRFNRKYIMSESGCWEWQGGLNDAGYGRFAVSGNFNYRAHRWSYQNLVGPIPVGLTLDHLCRNRKCVNPEHLEPVTQGENVRRAQADRMVRKTQCKHGHDLTPDNILRRSGSNVRLCKTCRHDIANRAYAKKMGSQ